MKRIFLLTALLSTLIFPQVLKEFEIRPTENRGQVPIFRDYPDKAAIILYTKFANLRFKSSFGIYKELGDPEGGKYIIVIEPTRQTIEVSCAGYKTEQIKITDLQPRDVLYYEALPKKEEVFQGIAEVGVTVQVTPSDSKILVDGGSFPNDLTTKLAIGKHSLRIEKPGYTPTVQEINVTPEQTFFKINLTTNDPVSVIINSTPSDAEIFIEGMSKGKTRKTLFLYPGIYELLLIKSGYLTVSENITVTTDEKSNNFRYILTKNTGKLKIEVSPAIATVRINKEVVNAYDVQELTPGTYQIEAEAETYYAYKGTVELKLGETKTERIALTQKAGKLQFAINPPEAECVLTQNGVEKYRWTGLKILSTTAEGTYDLTAKAQGYKSYTGKITIRENQTTVEDIQMTAGSDGPDWMIWVEGGTFTMGSISGESDEKPTHKVTLNGYFIGKTEVTQELWQSVMGNNPANFKGSRSPVLHVSWYDAVEFCNKLSEKEGLQKAYSGSGSSITCDFTANGYRLPTEAEWEYAARGGASSTNTKYSGSNNIDEVAWYGSNSGSTTHDVGTKSPNPLGIYDMSGNVWEWCWDWYGANYYSSSPVTNPEGSDSGSDRVLRGGGWDLDAEYCRVAARVYYSPDHRYNYNGFRLARSK